MNINDSNNVLFYGDVSEKGYIISYILLRRNIEHNFIICDQFILSLFSQKEIRGFDLISDYLNRFQYIIDFPEYKKWRL